MGTADPLEPGAASVEELSTAGAATLTTGLVDRAAILGEILSEPKAACAGQGHRA